MLPWYLGFKALGQDDKNSIRIDRSVPLATTDHNHTKSIVNPNVLLESGDHNWACDKIILSGTGEFNIGENASDSLFSGGVNGRLYYSVSLHDGAFQPSNCFNHCVVLLDHLHSGIRRDVISMEN
eukprot:11527203-Ditylum_brightwellii.AAC.1